VLFGTFSVRIPFPFVRSGYLELKINTSRSGKVLRRWEEGDERRRRRRRRRELAW
jgi:hypothetical protein